MPPFLFLRRLFDILAANCSLSIALLKITAKSRAVLFCPLAVKPLDVLQTVLLAPRLFALAVISLAKTFSEPAIFSAKATLASLAEARRTALIKSLAGYFLPLRK